MPKRYSSGKIINVLRSVEKGNSLRLAAKTHRVAVSTVRRWVELRKEQGTSFPGENGTPGGTKIDALSANRLEIKRMVMQDPRPTLEHIREALQSKCAIGVSTATIWRFLNRQNLTKSQVMRDQRRS